MGKLLRNLGFASPVLIALSLVYLPNFWSNVIVLIDFYSPWVAFESPLYDAYHQLLVSTLTEKPEIPLPEITAAEANYDVLFAKSDGFTFPIVIRGFLGNTSAVQKWGNPNWWTDNFGDDEVMCSTGTNLDLIDGCTVQKFFTSLKEGTPYYISGASGIFEKHPELHDMVDNEAIREVEPGKRVANQIFMGLPDMGSDIHCAIGINIFRQVAGQKKWWFIPPHQTAYLKPAINVNGFSAHTMTMIGKEGRAPSPWLSKVVRYTTVLNPGDVLVNPPWFWHGILNLGNRSNGDLVIGAPSRYGRGETRPAGRVLPSFRTNPLYSVNAFLALYLKYGAAAFKPGFKLNLQADIAGNRKDRKEESGDQVIPGTSGKMIKDRDMDDDAHPME